ncbi:MULTISPECIES: HEAT repeat domain-containing protein [unclassified Microcoleus]|uniref:HEAT repeat domain-containing protein n=1 Tax=unclassified Microcoleus TaxID=2642155 RepID=UPI002FD3DF26
MTSELTDALNRILSWIERHEPSWTEYLYSGLSKDEIDDLVRDLPIEFPPELYELYQWRNGAVEGDEWKETAWIFHSWTFRPLQEVVAGLHRDIFTHQTIQTDNIADVDIIKHYWKNCNYLNIFYQILWEDNGCVLINNILNLCPIIFQRLEEGELTLLEKYTSLTSMMLTIAECYEAGAYFIGDYIYRHPEKEYQIWRKYNFQIIEFALQAIQQGSLCGRFFTYFSNDLIEFKDPRTVEPLIQGLELLNHQNVERLNQQNNDPFLYYEPKEEVARILGELGDTRAVPVLIAALKDDCHNNWDYQTKVSAAKALGQLKDEQATYPLIEALQDNKDEVRQMAVWPLGEIGDLKAVDSLIDALRDSDYWVKQATSEAWDKLAAKFPELEEEIPF